MIKVSVISPKFEYHGGLPMKLQYFMSRHHEHFLQATLVFVLASLSVMVYGAFYGL